MLMDGWQIHARWLQLNEMEAKLRTVQGEHAGTQERLQQLQEAMQGLETLRDQLRSELQEAKTHLASQTARADAAEHRARDASDAKERLAAQADEQRRSFAELTAQRAAEIQQLREENATRNNRISELEAAQAEHRATIATLQAEIAKLQQQAEVTKAGTDTMSRQQAEQVRSVAHDNKRVRCGILRSPDACVPRQISTLQAQVRALEQRVADRDAELAAQQRQLDCANE